MKPTCPQCHSNLSIVMVEYEDRSNSYAFEIEEHDNILGVVWKGFSTNGDVENRSWYYSCSNIKCPHYNVNLYPQDLDNGIMDARTRSMIKDVIDNFITTELCSDPEEHATGIFYAQLPEDYQTDDSYSLPLEKNNKEGE